MLSVKSLFGDSRFYLIVIEYSLNFLSFVLFSPDIIIYYLQIRTMKANYTIEAGDVRVIRPLVYVREKSTRDFSQQSRLPIINENCPACFEQPKERDRVKKLLVQEESMIPNLFYNLKRALVPLMDDAVYDVMATVAAAADARGRNPLHRLPQKLKAGTGSGSGTSSSDVAVTTATIDNTTAIATGTTGIVVETDEEEKEEKEVAVKGEGGRRVGDAGGHIDTEKDTDGKRKRTTATGTGLSSITGPGPGLFGSASRLTNGKDAQLAQSPIAAVKANTNSSTGECNNNNSASGYDDDNEHTLKRIKNSSLMD
jgi:hypothetical protein